MNERAIDETTGEIMHSDNAIISTTQNFEMTSVGLNVIGKPTFEEWEAFGKQLNFVDSAVGWWVGDWECYGEREYGEDYAQALGEKDYQTKANYKWIANSFSLSRRRESLTIKHHGEVAALGEEQQEHYLELAEAGQWSVNELRQAIKTDKVKAALSKNQLAAACPAYVWAGHAEQLLDFVPDRSIDLLLTDPPYSTDVADFEGFLDGWLIRALDTVADTGRAYICAGPYPLELLSYLKRLTTYSRLIFGNVLVWTYRNTLGPATEQQFKNNWQAIFYLYGRGAEPLDTPLLTERFSVLDINAPDGRLGNRFFEWQKPDELAERLIRLSSQSGDIILDPFAGTGTFGRCAALLGRRSLSAEPADKQRATMIELGGIEINDADAKGFFA